MPNESLIDSAIDTPGVRSAPLSASGRVEAFSDGVLAIAITLLVLDLKVPEGEPGTVVAAIAGSVGHLCGLPRLLFLCRGYLGEPSCTLHPHSQGG